MTAPKKLIALATLGGTISMRVEGGLAVPSLGADDVAGLLGPDHGLRCVEVARVGGSEVDFDHLCSLTDTIAELAASGASAVVVTTGTDSIEETAAWLTYTGPWPVPLVVTGSMLPGGEPGGDATANLATAVAAARDFNSPQPVVAFAGRLWLGRQAQKVSGIERDAFAAPGRTPLAKVDDTGRLLSAGPLPPEASSLGPPQTALDPVPLVTAAMGVDGGLLRRAAEGHPAVVVAGNGAGNLPPRAAEAAMDLARSGTLVAVATRAADGRTGAVYGYPGSGGQLVAASVVLARHMTPHQLRVFLTLARSHDDDPHALRSALNKHLETLS